ncbi:class I SAM-dependent methyltransferase [Allocoleopsis sp.]|uniref:class I SAM-dependent methyltransferase n=1 Tax=Allocoleopsis sp. TaxID=3088169 RepID=UPI002FD13567
MIEPNNLEINVDELMQKVRDEVARRHKFSLPGNGGLNNFNEIVLDKDSPIEILLSQAELFSQVPTELPDKFNRFPFSLSKELQKFVLKLYGFIFKKQQVVNFSLIQAQRESTNLNRELFTRVSAQLMDLQSQVKELNERLKAIDERYTKIDERYTKNDSYLKSELTQQKRSLSLFLEEAQQRSPEFLNQGQLQAVVNEEQHLLDAFYTAFENQFRGEREDILDRLKVYLPLLEEAKVGTSEFPILDVGCGRGEWLELLREAGYTATGLDHNRVMVDYCRSREFKVVEGDVISHLRTLPDLSLGAVTGFHIIEHLPFPVLMQFFNEVVRVLKPGGLAIFETPNPKNIVVGACNFYADPTHKNPLFPETIQFILESQGLSTVKILYLNPVEGSPFSQEDASWQLLHNWFFCARDYAVVGYKL